MLSLRPFSGSDAVALDTLWRCGMKRDPDYVTAAEIAAFQYCPESWRLGHVLKKPAGNTDALQTGTMQHARWQVTERRSHRALMGSLLLAALALGCAVCAVLFY